MNKINKLFNADEQYFEIYKGFKIDDYIVEDYLGSGTESDVYKVKKKDSKDYRALKIFHQKCEPEWQYGKGRTDEYMENLNFILKELSSITEMVNCDFLDVGEFNCCINDKKPYKYKKGKYYYMIVEYFEGEQLSDKNQNFAISDASDIMAKLLLVLKESHKKKIYLSDLHGHNILFNEKLKTIKIVDFTIPVDTSQNRIRKDIGSLCQLLEDIICEKDLHQVKEIIPHLEESSSDNSGKSWYQNRYNTADEMLEEVESLKNKINTCLDNSI